ncbi:MAG TPA: efflux transporter outer membrane subunit [Verrucomicrobiae bacterium]|nr:efflux transporter outer membrane subunit [Verrucomicrobiae bacterium]
MIHPLVFMFKLLNKGPRAGIFGFFLLCLFLAGCAVGPDYHRPEIKSPPAFRGEESSLTNSFADLPWWEVFHDSTLQSLIRTALTNNYDLRIAVSRVEQARAIADQARGQFFPQLNYAGLAGKGKNVGAGNAPSPTGVTGGFIAADVNASWEPDLWGRIRRLNESARAQWYASDEARRDVMTSVIAQIAQDYFQLLALEEEMEIAQQSTNSFGDSLKIFTQRLQGGVASRLETSSAEALMHSAASTIYSLNRQILLLEDQISVLLGQNPGPILRAKASLESQIPPEVPAGLPSVLLERRPDIREAEQQLRSANAQVGVAKADFFPQLNLTALLGQVSPELSAFTSGGATAWGVAAGLTGPLFHGGQIRGQYRQAKAAREEAALRYHAAVLRALQEVSDALISRTTLAGERAEQTASVEAYRVAVDMVMKRYQSGNASYYEVLLEQQQLFPAETSLVQTRLNQLIAVVQLYRALGGGWKN